MLPNVLSFDIDANPGMSLTLNTKKVSQSGYKLENRALSYRHDISTQTITPEAYEKLILDAVKGDATNFVHWEEVYYSWRFIDSVRTAWDNEEVNPDELTNYNCNTMGPKISDELLAKDGNYWFFDPTK